MALHSVNPATEEIVKSYDELSAAQLDARLERAITAFDAHRALSIAERAKKMARAGELLLQDKERLAQLIVTEMGKPVTPAVAEVEKCAWVCRYYAEEGARLVADTTLETGGMKSFTRCLPLGPVLAVMPWNFPFWQVFRFAAPALVAGNVGLLKHASNVPGCALAIEEVFYRAGFDEGAFQTLLIGSSKVEGVIADERVVAVTLTGSEGAGVSVATAAGKHLKKSVLELGGSDPFIVLPSANVAEAAKTAVTARTLNSGQSCIAAKRFIVHERVYDEFQRRFVEGMAKLKTGDPTDPQTQVGPLATAAIRDEVEAQVEDAIRAGARAVVGGRRREGRGYFYLPTVLVDVPKRARAYGEEVFGPVASLFKVASVDDAISLANDSRFGLASSVWSEDEAEIERCINELEAGQTFINAMVSSDPRLPFGGVKKSGYGRELSREGIREFVNLKTVSWRAQETATE